MASSKNASASVEVLAESNPETGKILASAYFETSVERIFTAISTSEICDWWVRPGVFNTQEWAGDLRVGGKWAAAGIGGGQKYQLEGEYTQIEKPNRLSHTWHAIGSPAGSALLSYELTPTGNGVELKLTHTGIMNLEILEKTRAGWQTSLMRLHEIISTEIG